MESFVANASSKLKVVYGDTELYPGEELTPTQVQNEPKVTWAVEQGALYTLYFTDIDIPESFGFPQFTHWLVVNISANDIKNGTNIFSYIGSGPPQGTGLHRYIFVLYKQQGRIGPDVTDNITDNQLSDRGTFNIEDFQKKTNLEGPLASNYYRAQYDDYVPILMKAFSAKYSS